MTDPTPEEEEAVRRALREVADRTQAASEEPPPLLAFAPPLARRDRVERGVLGAVAAAVVLVGGVLAVVLAAGGGDGDEVEVADAETTTTEATSSTSSSSTSTSATTATTTGTTAATATSVVPVEEPERGVVLAAGETWRVERTGTCLRVVAVDETTDHCDLDVRGGEPAVLVHRIIPRGDVWVIRVGDATSADYGGTVPLPGFVDDPFVAGVRYLVTDSAGAGFTLRQGDAILGAISGDTMVTELFEPYDTYRRASGSLTMGNLVEIGAYQGDGGPCVVAFQLTPAPQVLADDCRPQPFVVLVPTSRPMLLDPFGLAPLSNVTEWSCTLPSGASCSTGNATPIADLGVSVLSWSGPLSVDDGGVQADHVTVHVGDLEFEAEVPTG